MSKSGISLTKASISAFNFSLSALDFACSSGVFGLPLAAEASKYGLINSNENPLVASSGSLLIKTNLSPKACLYVFANGDYFIGNKEKENFGVYIDRENKYQYEGDWVSGKPHGEGK